MSVSRPDCIIVATLVTLTIISLHHSITPPLPMSLQIPSTSTCAFLFIDLQPVFTDRFNGTAFQTQTECALAAARAAVTPDKIVHLRANYVGSKMQPFSRVLDPSKAVPSDIKATTWAEELPGELVMMKTTINGFHETDLEQYLTGLGVDTIILSGLMTCCCVHETAIGGLVRGFAPVLVEDACVDKNEDKQAATIMLFKDYLYQTCLLKEVTERFAAGP
jgi:nicotinamidase-related amidase